MAVAAAASGARAGADELPMFAAAATGIGAATDAAALWPSLARPSFSSSYSSSADELLCSYNHK